jgi:hypothetical protein
MPGMEEKRPQMNANEDEQLLVCASEAARGIKKRGLVQER